jgi:hypothetical protein
MTEDLDFDLEKFHEQVSSDFFILKVGKAEVDLSPDHLKKSFGKSLWGCIFIPIFGFFGKSIGKYHKKEAAKRNYETFKKEAEDLLAEKDIKEAICKSLRKREEILTEDTFIRNVTEALAEKNLRKQFVIPLESMLFACVAFQISEHGIQNFCREI